MDIEIITMSCGHDWWLRTMDYARKCSWRAGSYLASKMQNNDFESNERVLIAIKDNRIAGFCTFANQDELSDEYGFTPFIGFVFVDEKYRGNRISEKLIDAACNYARQQNYSKVYLMSGELGLYEKYGFVKMGEYKTIYDTVDQLFSKNL